MMVDLEYYGWSVLLVSGGDEDDLNALSLLVDNTNVVTIWAASVLESM
jgi:hypothetical protein